MLQRLRSSMTLLAHSRVFAAGRRMVICGLPQSTLGIFLSSRQTSLSFPVYLIGAGTHSGFVDWYCWPHIYLLYWTSDCDM